MIFYASNYIELVVTKLRCGKHIYVIFPSLYQSPISFYFLSAPYACLGEGGDCAHQCKFVSSLLALDALQLKRMVATYFLVSAYDLMRGLGLSQSGSEDCLTICWINTG